MLNITSSMGIIFVPHHILRYVKVLSALIDMILFYSGIQLQGEEPPSDHSGTTLHKSQLIMEFL